MSFKKVDGDTPKFSSSSKEEEVNAYKFKVEMVVSLFASSELEASTMLDAQGGFVISRNVNLLDVQSIHSTDN